MGLTGLQRIPHDHSFTGLQTVHLSPSAETSLCCSVSTLIQAVSLPVQEGARTLM